VLVRGREMLMLASYSYLGLIGHPAITAAARDAVARWGTGTHGTRLLVGCLPLHEELEAALAAFAGRYRAMVFSSGYATNVGVIAALCGRHDAIFADQFSHVSLLDGCALSGAKVTTFFHNDMAHLERLLAQADPAAGKLVVADAVYSMDGDIADLPALVKLCRQHGAWLMVDEAHSIGVLGATGRGIEEHFNLPGVIDVKMGTLSKTIPATGGYVAGSVDLIDYLRHTARTYGFSGAFAPAQAGAALAALRVIQEEPERLRRLQENTTHYLGGLKQLGFDVMKTQTAIVPILCGAEEKACEMARLCQERGVFVLPILWPAVPADQARLRTTVTAAHAREDVDEALEALGRAGRATGLIR
jgi:glycine C-acetyltransferase